MSFTGTGDFLKLMRGCPQADQLIRSGVSGRRFLQDFQVDFQVDSQVNFQLKFQAEFLAGFSSGVPTP